MKPQRLEPTPLLLGCWQTASLQKPRLSCPALVLPGCLQLLALGLKLGATRQRSRLCRSGRMMQSCLHLQSPHSQRQWELQLPLQTLPSQSQQPLQTQFAGLKPQRLEPTLRSRLRRFARMALSCLLLQVPALTPQWLQLIAQRRWQMAWKSALTLSRLQRQA